MQGGCRNTVWRTVAGTRPWLAILALASSVSASEPPGAASGAALDVAPGAADVAHDDFPRPVLGFYSVPAHACSALAAAGFTVAQNYRFESRRALDADAFANDARAYLDEAQRHGLRVLLGVPRNWLAERRENVLRQAIRLLRDHRAILAWYEDERAQEGDLGAVEFLNRVVTAEDPEHGLIIEEGRDLDGLRDIGRIRMFTYYPVTHEARRDGRLRTIGQRFPTHNLRVPFWPVLQAFGRDLIRGYPKQDFEAPTRHEMEYTMASALIAGAQGFFFYTYNLSTRYDPERAARGQYAYSEQRPLSEVSERLWQSALSVGGQARLLLGLLRGGEPSDDVQTIESGLGEVEVGSWWIDDGLLVIVANVTYRAGPVTLRIPSRFVNVRRLHGLEFGPRQSVRDASLQVSVSGPGAAIVLLGVTPDEPETPVK